MIVWKCVYLSKFLFVDKVLLYMVLNSSKIVLTKSTCLMILSVKEVEYYIIHVIYHIKSKRLDVLISLTNRNLKLKLTYYSVVIQSES